MRRRRPGDIYLVTDPGYTERRRDRTATAKSYRKFDPAIGKMRGKIRMGGGVAHYWDGSQFEDIDLQGDDRGETIRTEFAPYRLDADKDDVAFTFASRVSGRIRCKLVELDGLPVAQVPDYNGVPTLVEEGVIWSNVSAGLDFRIVTLSSKCKLEMITRNANAPHTMKFRVRESETSGFRAAWEAVRVFDALGRQVRATVVTSMRPAEPPDLIYTVTMRIFPQTWLVLDYGRFGEDNGEWVNSVAYPLTLDPDITETIAAGADDGYTFQSGSSWNNSSTSVLLTYNNPPKESATINEPHFRFITIPTIASEDTIDLANLKPVVSLRKGDGTGDSITGDIWGDDVDSCAALSSSHNRSNTWTQTTASVGTGELNTVSAGDVETYDVTTIVQEIVDRAGWAANNNIGFAIEYTGYEGAVGGDGTNGVYFAALENTTYDEASLEIDFTGAAPAGSALPAMMQHGLYAGEPL